MQERRPVAPRLTAAVRRHPPALAVTIAAGVVALDQLTKEWALRSLSDGPIDLFWTLRLRLAFNTGASFSIGSGQPGLFALIGIVVVGVLIASLRGLRSVPTAVALGLIVGGALGNLTDRLLRSHGGAVIDFVDLQWWPVFNLADSCLFLGVGTLVFTTFREPSRTAPDPEPTAE